jgi:DNA-binding MarR family transcriptional regulator/N-acetylglutamate synthase-like GNAT family acetyltransferase
MADSDLPQRIEAVRRFNRFYTGQIGVLQEGLLESPFSLTATRVLYELAHREAPTAAELAADLGLDGGYLSRILRRFQKLGYVEKKRSDRDARRSLLELTRAGRRAFAPLEKRSANEVGSMLGALATGEQARLLEAMATIETLLGRHAAPPASYLLRPHRPGDVGWVIHRHGALYAEEYGWDETFEALVAEIGAKFIREFDPKRERCWIAEQDGGIVGSVFVVRESDAVAKLRLLYVEPAARGLGIGKRLVAEALRFARQTGYARMMLWTNKNLDAARHIYEEAGFTLVEESPHHSFGHDLVGQTWSLDL